MEGSIISGYRLLAEAGQNYPYLAGSRADHQRRFGHPPWLVAGGRGVSSPTNEALARQAGVTRIVLPYPGKAPPQRVRHERQRWFRSGSRLRAGMEGRISVLRRSFGLDRYPDHGEDGMGRWVGWGIVTANLATTARTLTRRAATGAARVA